MTDTLTPYYKRRKIVRFVTENFCDFWEIMAKIQNKSRKLGFSVQIVAIA